MRRSTMTSDPHALAPPWPRPQRLLLPRRPPVGQGALKAIGRLSGAGTCRCRGGGCELVVQPGRPAERVEGGCVRPGRRPARSATARTTSFRPAPGGPAPSRVGHVDRRRRPAEAAMVRRRRPGVRPAVARRPRRAANASRPVGRRLPRAHGTRGRPGPPAGASSTRRLDALTGAGDHLAGRCRARTRRPDGPPGRAAALRPGRRPHLGAGGQCHRLRRLVRRRRRAPRRLAGHARPSPGVGTRPTLRVVLPAGP